MPKAIPSFGRAAGYTAGSPAASDLPVSGGFRKPVVDIRGFSFSYEGAAPAPENFSLRLRPGECCWLQGGTGTGKSTLLKAVKGVLPKGKAAGSVGVDEGATQGRRRIGLILQNPDPQLLAPTVGAECAFGLENMGVAEGSMRSRIERALRETGLSVSLSEPVDNLSMGQKYRLLTAAMLAMDPKIMLFDEPDNQLDPHGLDALAQIVRQLKRRGVAVVITGRPVRAFEPVIDLRLDLRPDIGADRSVFKPTAPDPPPGPINGGAPILSVDELVAPYGNSRIRWRDLSFAVGAGERVLVTGVNGSGKSTLLQCLCGFLEPAGGQVRIFGRRPRFKDLVGRVGHHFQNPQRQLFEATVADEIAFTLKRCGWSNEAVRCRVQEMLEACGLERQAEKSPHRLSFGQQHLVALAAAVAPGPRLLILDDPSAGLDTEKQAALFGIIDRINRDCGTAVVLARHDAAGFETWAHQHVHLPGGGNDL